MNGVSFNRVNAFRLLVEEKRNMKSSHDWSRHRRLEVALLAQLCAALFVVAPAFAHTGHLFRDSFGSPGSGAGQLSLQSTNYGNRGGSGIASNQATGNVYVADTGNHRVDEFDAGGTFIRAWGYGVADGSSELQVCTLTCRAGIPGSAPGQLLEPTAIAVDNSVGGKDDVYVADGADHAITKFDSEGHLVSGWGASGQLQGTPVLATGTGDVVSGAATGTGDVVVGSKTVTNVSTSTGAFTVGLGIHGLGIEAGPTYITAVGSGTLTLSRPASSTYTGVELTTNHRFITNVSTASGAFQGSQTISGPGIPPGTQIEEATPGYIALSTDATPGAGISLSGQFPFGTPAGVAVDPSGDLWVSAAVRGFEAQMFEFAPDGSFLTDWPHITAEGVGIAVDATGDLYAPDQVGTAKFQPDGTRLGEVEVVRAGNLARTGLTVDPATNDIYIDNGPGGTAGTEINHFPASCEPTTGPCAIADTFGNSEEAPAGRLKNGQGLAVGPDHTVYVTEADADKVFAYRQVRFPDTTTLGATAIGVSTATLEGEVNPDGVPVTGCLFEYGPTKSYGHQAPCVESPTEIGGGSAPVHVHSDISGLEPSFYHYRLVATNANGSSRGADATFGASIDSQIVQSADQSTTTLTAEINPHGSDTHCLFRYIEDSAYRADGERFGEGTTGLPCEPSDLGAGEGDVKASVSLSGLRPGTNYRYRFVAESGEHVSEGPVEAMYTYSDSLGACPNESARAENLSLGLPDCRAYEQVSLRGNSQVYKGRDFAGTEAGLVPNGGFPEQASSTGNAVAFVGAAGGVGEGEGSGNSGAGEGDQYLARREATGWKALDITPSGAKPETFYEAFTQDLSVAQLVSASREQPLAAGVETNCPLLYTRVSDLGPFKTLFTSEGKSCRRPFFVGGSADRAAQVFESPAVKAEGAKPASGNGHENVYLERDGELHTVNVLPKGKADPNATVGALTGEADLLNGVGVTHAAINTENVVSSDVSRIYWTDLATGIVYLRKNPAAEPSAFESSGHCTEAEKACTVQVSGGPATYETASSDGRYGYYVESGQLWRYDAEAESREAITAPKAGVLGVIGINRTGGDGSYLYFVAKASLAPNRVDNGAGAEEAQDGEPNLYVSHEGTTEFIATLNETDNSLGADADSNAQAGDWRGVHGRRTAQVSVDGSAVVFMSSRQLTTYDNMPPTGGCIGGRCPEIYIYDTGSAKTICASCNPSGVRPVELTVNGPVTFLPPDFGSLMHARQLISADGNRVLFDSYEPLIPADINGTRDVYEWEREGTGGCTQGSVLSGGCVSLLSSGKVGSYATLLDASASLDDVFLISASPLSPTDRDEKPDLYDARSNGGFPLPPEAVACESPGACHGPPTAGPSPQSAGSASFNATETTSRKKTKKKRRHPKRQVGKRHSHAANKGGKR
jgi:hypothetical protein